MKASFSRFGRSLSWGLSISSICWVPLVSAQVVTTFNFNGINAPIPDADLSGLVDTRQLTLSENLIQNVTVMLSISGIGNGAFNGDFYAYLQHGSGLAVLLNRVGLDDAAVASYKK